MNSDENQTDLANTESSIRPKESLGQASNMQAYNLKAKDTWV